jgi:hypothetical protein
VGCEKRLPQVEIGSLESAFLRAGFNHTQRKIPPQEDHGQGQVFKCNPKAAASLLRRNRARTRTALKILD